MRVLLTSGIFAQSVAFRALNLQETTETILAGELARRGIDVDVSGPYVTTSWRGFDVVHMHHLANHCLRTYLPIRARLVFTRHRTTATQGVRRDAVLRQTYRAADRLVALSGFEFERLQRTYGPTKPVLIRNGIDGDVFSPSGHVPPETGEAWELLYVGQLVALKRVHLAIDAVADLKLNGLTAHLTLVYQQDWLENSLREHAERRGVTDRVEFVGPLGRRQLADRMRAAHLLVLPSETESLPTVVTEAMFTGLPVLAFNVGGIAEQLPGGYPLPPADRYDQYLSTLRLILSDYVTFAASVADFLPVARRLYSITSMVDKHVAMYQELLRNA